MEIYRIVKSKYADGLYASGRAGRWNLEDQMVIYASSSRALATLELLVHQSHVKAQSDFKVLVIEVPDNSMHSIDLKELPLNWRGLSAYYQLQLRGSAWYDQKNTLLLKVPSAVIPKEYNYLIHTRHQDYENNVKIKSIEDYFWDARI